MCACPSFLQWDDKQVSTSSPERPFRATSRVTRDIADQCCRNPAQSPATPLAIQYPKATLSRTVRRDEPPPTSRKMPAAFAEPPVCHTCDTADRHWKRTPSSLVSGFPTADCPPGNRFAAKMHHFFGCELLRVTLKHFLRFEARVLVASIAPSAEVHKTLGNCVYSTGLPNFTWT